MYFFGCCYYDDHVEVMLLVCLEDQRGVDHTEGCVCCFGALYFVLVGFLEGWVYDGF